MTIVLSSHYYPIKGSKSVSCFHLSKFGNKNGSRVLDLIGLMEAASLACSELAKGFCMGALRIEPSTLKLWHPGHNNKV